MTDTPDQDLTKPPRVPVTPEFVAEQEARQRAYSQERRRYMAAFEPHREISASTPPASPSFNLATRSRTRQRREDPRQLSFDL